MRAHVTAVLAGRDHSSRRTSAPYSIMASLAMTLRLAPRRRQDLNWGWRFCRQGQVLYLVDSSCFLVGLTPQFSPVFGRNCFQIVPTPASHPSRALELADLFDVGPVMFDLSRSPEVLNQHQVGSMADQSAVENRLAIW